MSDLPVDGWWQASDRRWYPPETHPAHRPDGPMPPPDGWVQDADGSWRPPRSDGATTPPAPPVAAPPEVPRRFRRRWSHVAMIAAGVLVTVMGVVSLVVSGDEPEVRVDSVTLERPTIPPATVVADPDATTTTTVA